MECLCSFLSLLVANQSALCIQWSKMFSKINNTKLSTRVLCTFFGSMPSTPPHMESVATCKACHQAAAPRSLRMQTYVALFFLHSNMSPCTVHTNTTTMVRFSKRMLQVQHPTHLILMQKCPIDRPCHIGTLCIQDICDHVFVPFPPRHRYRWVLQSHLFSN